MHQKWLSTWNILTNLTFTVALGAENHFIPPFFQRENRGAGEFKQPAGAHAAASEGVGSPTPDARATPCYHCSQECPSRPTPLTPITPPATRRATRPSHLYPKLSTPKKSLHTLTPLSLFPSSVQWNASYCASHLFIHSFTPSRHKQPGSGSSPSITNMCKYLLYFFSPQKGRGGGSVSAASVTPSLFPLTVNIFLKSISDCCPHFLNL